MSPRSAVQPGMLEDCLNYEVGSLPGYQPSGGFERFDGRMSPSTRKIWDMVIPNSSIWPAATPVKQVSVSSQDSAPRSVWVSPDGDWLYVLGGALDIVYQYFLNTPFDLTTATYASKSFDLQSQDTIVHGIWLKPDGTKLYAVGDSNNRIFQYTLLIPFDISSAVYDNKSLNVAGEETSPRGMCMSPDGTVLLLAGQQSDEINQYNLSTAWDVSTGTAVDVFSLSSWSANPVDVAVAPGGKMMYVADAGGIVWYFSLSTAWDLTTAAVVDWSYDVAALTDLSAMFVDANNGAMFVSPTDIVVRRYGWLPRVGSNLWLDGWLGEETISEVFATVIDVTPGPDTTTVRFAYYSGEDSLDLSDVEAVWDEDNGVWWAFGLRSGWQTGTTKSWTAEDTSVKGIYLRSNGVDLYHVGDAGNEVNQYAMSTPWSLTTAAYATKTFSVAGQTTSPTGLRLSADGTKTYVLGNDGNVYQYTNSAGAWNINSATYASKSLDAGSEIVLADAFDISPDGTKVYIVSRTNTIFEYTLSTAWDISTATFIQSWDIETYDNSHDEWYVTGITFKSDGSAFYLLRRSFADIRQYDCSTAWDISTASPVVDQEMVLADTLGAPEDIFRVETDTLGPQMYITSNTSCYQWELDDDLTLTALVDVATDTDDYFNQLAAAAAVLRARIEPVPGTGKVLGVKWYKEQCYAVRDYYNVRFAYGDICEPQIGQHVLLADSETKNTAYGDEGICRGVVIETGTFSNSDVAGHMLVEPLNASFDAERRLGKGWLGASVLGLAHLHFTSGSTEPTIGQELTGQTSLKTVKVYRVELQSGAWANGDAAGIVYCTDIDGAMTDGELLDLVSPSTANVMTLDEVIFGASQGPGVVVHSLDHSPADMAGLYRSTNEGWEKIELGHFVRFNTGTNEPNVVSFGADTSSATVVATDWKTPQTQRDLGGWTPSAGSELDAITASGGAYIYTDSEIGHLNIDEAERLLLVRNFDFNVPDGARVVGVEIEITAKNTSAATAGSALIRIQPFLNDANAYEGGVLPGVIQKRQSVGDLTTSFAAYTFGGANDLWGADIDRDMVNNAGFGLKFSMEWDSAAVRTGQQIDLVRMRIHYVEQGDEVWFYDTVAVADYTSARAVHVNLEDGAWDGSGVGTLYLYDLKKLQLPTKNIQIRTAAAGAGTLIANLVGNEQPCSLPGGAQLAEKNSKYEMIAENVYARDDLEAIYGVSGAGRAFSYDGSYVRFVHSGLSPDLDMPRHVALFQFRLWLGYGFGEAAISIAGDPLTFDGTLNAVATGFGRPVRAMLPLAGKTMGIFTDQSIYAVTVDGADFDQQIFAPRSGAIEYTGKSVGKSSLYVDVRGVSMPSITDRYGDFEVGRLSRAVNRWLLPRIQNSLVNATRANRTPVAATVARAKNQYRVYFGDGYRLTLTLDEEGRVEITRQLLYLNADPSQYVRVGVTDSDVDLQGNDRMFFTMDENPDVDLRDYMGYVYEEDRGTSYDGSSYKRWIELAPIPGNGLHTNTVWSVWHLYGLAHGHAALKVTSAVDFVHPADPDNTTEDSNYNVVLGAASNAVATGLVPYYWDKNRLQRRGRYMGLRIQNESDRELEHVLQHITFVDEKPAREER